MKITPDAPKNENGLTQMIKMGKSIRQIWVNKIVSGQPFTLQLLVYNQMGLTLESGFSNYVHFVFQCHRECAIHPTHYGPCRRTNEEENAR